jgi:hypothetical protein
MKKSICLYLFSFLIAFCLVSTLLPYPILSRYTNSTNSQMSISNQFHETEISQIEESETEILDISWDKGICSLIEEDVALQLYDFSSEQTFSLTRIGGKNHADVVPTTQDDYVFITTLLPQDECVPVAVLYNSSTIIPASLSTYMHGYPDKENAYLGHYCLHFKASKTHAGADVDFFNQKAVKSAKAKAKSLLTA